MLLYSLLYWRLARNAINLNLAIFISFTLIILQNLFDPFHLVIKSIISSIRCLSIGSILFRRALSRPGNRSSKHVFRSSYRKKRLFWHKLMWHVFLGVWNAIMFLIWSSLQWCYFLPLASSVYCLLFRKRLDFFK